MYICGWCQWQTSVGSCLSYKLAFEFDWVTLWANMSVLPPDTTNLDVCFLPRRVIAKYLLRMCSLSSNNAETWQRWFVAGTVWITRCSSQKTGGICKMLLRCSSLKRCYRDAGKGNKCEDSWLCGWIKRLGKLMNTMQ